MITVASQLLSLIVATGTSVVPPTLPKSLLKPLVPNTLTLVDNNSWTVLSAENQSTANGSNAIFGFASASGGSGTIGVNGQSAAPNGLGIFGATIDPSGTCYGVWGQSSSTNGRGVAGIATATSGATLGVAGQVASTSGKAVNGNATATSGTTYGGYFQSNSYAGFGVYGLNTSTGPGTSDGVYGRSNNVNGRGVVGYVPGIGVTYAVIGWCDSSIGWGLWAQGRSGASGTKSFRIDHPTDPENRYLYHYSSEGPEPLNLYSGTVTTDARGEAWVQLPTYFQDINRDFRYSLTVVDDTDSANFTLAKIASEVRENRFKIRTSSPRTKVCWQVTGVRNDRWVQKYGAPVEEEKRGPEKGTYQHPELYGMPSNRGLMYRPSEAQAPKPEDPVPPMTLRK